MVKTVARSGKCGKILLEIFSGGQRPEISRQVKFPYIYEGNYLTGQGGRSYDIGADA